MKNTDITIIGGGMVGLALAALLKEADCQIKIIEKSQPFFEPHLLTNRVSAINFASQTMLEKVGAWQTIPENKRSPYTKMHVWEKDSFAKIEFDNETNEIKSLGLDQLGFIIENQHIQNALWQQVNNQQNVEIILAQPQTLEINDSTAFLTLNNNEILTSKLVIGADGANSWVRSKMNIPLISRDYQHTALVCNVNTQESHQQTAWQIFSPDSILAFLPFKDEHHCSIVWSLPPEKANQLVSCDITEFNKALTIAFDNKLGLCELTTDLQNPRGIYPLTARYCRNFAQNRVALIGDAAHTIHPLAGLGVNLGFADAIEMANQIKVNLTKGLDIGEYRQLRDYERKRKVEAVKLLGAMDVLKETFAGDNPVKKLVRGVGLSVTNQLPLIKNRLLQQSIGLSILSNI
ncbi:FAD-dependent monooxygenase [Phocoenobacter skyensis]|uniref:2-octaprenylphenol hydroxylase n=1 Tax=Phocoenobacter skyensis TaxID=97481 RepID=A0A1H7XZ90_9PAST|nr:FAD-dependent monooxygenase [Pasteurella skyensis]MDP8079795.1 FAD-dependent monooxygenase [Pasteurella skyensis]MDP8085736.1 FAD-dependent monooxygenase [Pasteurella skyensis]MDP8171169.1 FAD-dependent monooxygenase [Pasteurella skyensis]MDP8174996.1 FAD-dependent monooxygenase [Pasteurella skyensis]MDP8185564.1 FAD-dependent monooxygenase [Pasteurella skyensis]